MRLVRVMNLILIFISFDLYTDHTCMISLKRKKRKKENCGVGVNSDFLSQLL